MFVTVRPNIVEAEWAAEEEKDEKKSQKKKTSAETIRHLVLRTGCLIIESGSKSLFKTHQNKISKTKKNFTFSTFSTCN